MLMVAEGEKRFIYTRSAKFSLRLFKSDRLLGIFVIVIRMSLLYLKLVPLL